MRNFQKYFAFIFIIISFFGAIMTLKNLGMSESQYYGNDNDKWKTTMGEWITGIFIWGLIFQFLVYFLLFFYHLFHGLKYKIQLSITMLKIFGLAALLFLFWLVITLLVSNNGQHDLFWGPADTGLFFISISSLLINYLIFSLFTAYKIVAPLTLINQWDRNEIIGNDEQEAQ